MGGAVLVKPALSEDLNSRLTVDETSAASIPSAEDLVVGLLLAFRERPGHAGSCRALDFLVMLLKALLERQAAELLLGLEWPRRALSGVGHRLVGG